MKNPLTFVFRDVTKKIKWKPLTAPGLTTHGEQICLIFFAVDIEAAIACFEKHYPQHCKGGKIKPTISISIIK